MKGLVLILAVVLAASAPGQQPTNSPDQRPRFCAVDIFIDSGTSPLSAYQLEFSADDHSAKIAGIEGGEHDKFKTPPYYDPQAMQQERVIIAAFSTAPPTSLPTSRTRIATIHVQVTGNVEPEFVVAPSVLATTQGKRIDAQVEAKPRENSSSNQDDQS